MRVVLDTNVLISSTLWHNSASQKVLFRLIRAGSKIFISEYILQEYFRVLTRDFSYANEEVFALEQKIKMFAAINNPKFEISAIQEDDSDNRILECAIEAKADYILTYDNHLLGLVDYRGIKIIPPEKLEVES